MPPACTIQDFIDAVKDRKSKAIRALDVLLGTPATRNTLKTHLQSPGVGHWSDFETGGPAITGQPWARNLLLGGVPGLLAPNTVSPDDVTHIDKWPPTQKAAIHKAVLEAYGTGSTVEFFWELTDAAEETTVISKDKAGNLTVTFQSPKSRLRRVVVAGQDEITVDVP